MDKASNILALRQFAQASRNFLLHYKWDERKNWSYDNLSTVDNPVLTSLNAQNNRENLEYLKPDQDKKVLGVYLTPNESNDLLFRKMEEKIKKTA